MKTTVFSLALFSSLVFSGISEACEDPYTALIKKDMTIEWSKKDTKEILCLATKTGKNGKITTSGEVILNFKDEKDPSSLKLDLNHKDEVDVTFTLNCGDKVKEYQSSGVSVGFEHEINGKEVEMGSCYVRIASSGPKEKVESSSVLLK